MYTNSFEVAVNRAMLYEVGGFWKLTPSVEAGLINTPAQRQAVGYVNDPQDRGGETKFGIAKNANPGTDITHLTWEQAKDIYYQKYWLRGKCDQLPNKLAILHFDNCVNHGILRANKLLQQSVGAIPDGLIGRETLDLCYNVDVLNVCENLCRERKLFYLSIVKKDSSQQKFLKGWLRRVNDLQQFLLQD